jgi:N4-gp56 family major capsid protein
MGAVIMAKTTIATGDATTKKLFEEKLYRDTVKESYFYKFMGEGANSLCQKNTKLSKSKGDNILFTLRKRLEGAGVTSGTTLEGNEEALEHSTYSVSLEQYRHAVRDAGELDRQRPAWDLNMESRDAIKEWGTEKIDSLCFQAVLDTPTRVFYRTASGNTTTGTAATAKGALVASTSNLTPSLISFAKAWARTGGNRSQTPLRPVKVDGKMYYVLLIHPDSGYDLKTDATWTQANREAMERGKTNPIFSGALGVWDGVIVHEHEGYDEVSGGGLIGTDAGSGSDVPWTKCVMMGAQSLLWAEGKRGKIVSEKFDYENEMGHAWGITCGVAKPKFDSLDYGSVGIYVSRTQISDAA